MRPTVSLVFVALALAFAACSDALPVEDAPCPCAVGWTCCADANVCVREDALCPSGSVVEPSSVALPLRGAQQFTARYGVTWSVEEGEAGGRIDADGVYTAPFARGTFHVLATRAGQEVARAEVRVGPSALELYSGDYGSTGAIDGVGDAARLGHIQEAIGDEEGHVYFVDQGAGAIRVLDLASKTVRTLLSGLAKPCHLALPGTSTAAAMAGRRWEIFFGECSDASVHALDPATGEVRLLAGGGLDEAEAGPGPSMHLHGLAGMDFVAPDFSQLVVAESAGRLRLVDAATGAVSFVAGSGTETGYVAGYGADARFGELGPVRHHPNFFFGVYVYDKTAGQLRSIVLTIPSGWSATGGLLPAPITEPALTNYTVHKGGTLLHPEYGATIYMTRGHAIYSLIFTNTIQGPQFRPFAVGSSRVDLQACKLEYSIVSPK